MTEDRELMLCKSLIAAEAAVLWLPCLAIPRTNFSFVTDGDDAEHCCFELALAKAAVWLMKREALTSSWQ